MLITEEQNKRSYKRIVAFIAIVFFISTRFMSYRSVSSTTYAAMVLLAELVFFVILLRNPNRMSKNTKMLPSWSYITLFSILPILNWISCAFAHNQEIIHSIAAWVPHYLILFYFVLAYYKVKFDDIIKIIIFFAILRTGITCIEQFTYPSAYPFAFRADHYDSFGNFKALEQRNGFYRFLISDAYFLVMFSGFYAYTKLTSRISLKYIFLFLISLFGIYMDGTRQVMTAFLASIIIQSVIFNKNRKWRTILLIFCFFVILYIYRDYLFSELLEKTTESEDSFGRDMSYYYLWNNQGDLFTILFGNGLGFSDKSEWGKEIMNMHDNMIRPHDVGIVGALFMVGWSLVLSFVAYYIFIVYRNWKHIDRTLQLYLLSMLIMIPFIFPLYNGTLPDYEMFLAFIFYLTDISIVENKAGRFGRI